MKIKAEEIIDNRELFQQGKGVSITLYRGDQVILAKHVSDYVNGFLMAGEPMPVVGYPVNLSVCSLETSYDDETNMHEVIVEGVFVNELKGEPNE